MAHWIIDTAGVGGIIVGLIAIPVLIAYVRMVHWIASAPKPPEADGHPMGGGSE